MIVIVNTYCTYTVKREISSSRCMSTTCNQCTCYILVKHSCNTVSMLSLFTLLTTSPSQRQHLDNIHIQDNCAISRGCKHHTQSKTTVYNVHIAAPFQPAQGKYSLYLMPQQSSSSNHNSTGLLSHCLAACCCLAHTKACCFHQVLLLLAVQLPARPAVEPLQREALGISGGRSVLGAGRR